MCEIKKKATSLDDQIEKLEEHGVFISDDKKAKEILADIGYYRLGFYLFPFEKTYPELGYRRRHDVVEGTRFEDAVALYYYDFELRNILYKYISRIEVSIRTAVIYHLSNKYKEVPTWYIDTGVVNEDFADMFIDEIYPQISNNQHVIKRHERKHPLDSHAPAWKTLEFLTFGNLIKLYSNLLVFEDQRLVSCHFGVNNTMVFYNYLEAIRNIRNSCAHGAVIFDYRTHKPVRKGPAGNFPPPQGSSLYATLEVIRFFLGSISKNRLNDMNRELTNATEFLFEKCHSQHIKKIIEDNTGIVINPQISPQNMHENNKNRCFIEKIFKFICRK